MVPRFVRRRVQWPLLGVALLLLAEGCYHYRAHVPGRVSASTPQGETVWSLAWGLAQEVPDVPDCHGQGLAEVTVTDNLGYSLLTVITLGFVSPKRVEWSCADPNPADAPFGGDPDDDDGADDGDEPGTRLGA